MNSLFILDAVVGIYSLCFSSITYCQEKKTHASNEDEQVIIIFIRMMITIEQM